MSRYIATVFTAVILFVPSLPARAAEGDAKEILDKGIKALGGEEKLAKAEAITWKTKGTIKFNDNENEFTGFVTIKGLDHFRRESANDQFSVVVVLAGEKGWRKFGDNASELEGDGLANEKRRVYLEVIPATLVPLKGKGFKFEAGGEEKVGDKPAVSLKATGPDDKTFTIFFDKESGLPVKMTAKVVGFQGQENDLETTYSDYKDFDGIKKATKIEVKRDGETFQKMEHSDFKVLDKVDSDVFTEPK
jgi:hypothetical protein